MSVRQYIGARYVTKIYENSLDPSSAEWEAGVSYEPLILVTFNNGSYLSKKEVPGSVGDPTSNPSYWVQTGFYNGQIASLQSQIDAINAALSNLNNAPFDYSENDDVIVIGDSWAVGLHATHGLTYWLDLYLPHDNFYHAESNGSGFAVVGNSFKDILDGITVPDNNTIKHIMVLGGLNDRNQAGLETALSTFLTSAHVDYPNATIDVIAANRLLFGGVSRYDYVNKYKKVCDNYTYARFIDATHIINAFEWYDTAHLNDAGYEELAKSIINVIKNGSYTTQTGYKTVSMSALGGDMTGSLNVVQGNDGGIYLQHGTINQYGTFTISGTIKNLDFTLAEDINSTDNYLGVCWIYLTDGDGSRTVPANISTPNSTTLRYTFVDTGSTYSHILIADTALYLGNLY